MDKHKHVVISILILFSFLFGFSLRNYYSKFLYFKNLLINQFGPISLANWQPGFEIVKIRSSFDGNDQNAYFLRAKKDTNKPLLVSLHTWSGDYEQEDELASLAQQRGWNYIHPDFRGPNQSTDSCLSDKVISDISDAINFAINAGSVDRNNIFICGVSGGGYAALGCYLKLRFKVKLFIVWAPISDLVSWYWQSVNRSLKYSEYVIKCTSEDNVYNEIDIKNRSPLFWECPSKPNGKIEIYAGIMDGYTGSVPVSHSIRFYNKLVEQYGFANEKVSNEDIIRLISRGVRIDPAANKIADRFVLFLKDTPFAKLTIYDGGHEILPEYCFSRMEEMLEGK